MSLLLIRNDITKVHADAIVNPSNPSLSEGRGTSRRIFLAAGEKALADACSKAGPIAVTEAAVTPAFNLTAQYIIHVAGPVWMDGKNGESEMLARTYENALKAARDRGCESVAFPLMSSGTYGFPKETALNTAVSAIGDFLMNQGDAAGDMTVYLVLYDKKSLAVSKKLFVSVEEYIDDNYIEENDQDYYRGVNASGRCSNNVPAKMMSAESDDFIFGDSMVVEPLESILSRLGETFSEMLLRLIDERGLTDPQVYHKANVDRKLFSKIRNNPDYSPAKKTVLAFAIALRLSMDETKDLLMKAGFTFSNSSKSDVIISYFIKNEIYDVFQINEMLFAYDQPTIGE